MAAYLYASIEITDPTAFAQYRDGVPAVIAAYGGRYLVRGGTTVRLEGSAPPPRIVIVEFPDMARLRAFYESPEYRPLLAIRERAARSTLTAIEGL